MAAPGAARPAAPERFDRYMERALYGSHGFFSTGRGRAGRRGDFVTSVEVGPLFGAVLARLVDASWDTLGQPDRFTVLDAGAGTGTLLRSLRAARPRCAASLELVAVERSPALRAEQPPEVHRLETLPDDPFDGVIVANELLDNLPVRVLRRRGPVVEEAWVDPVEGLVAVSLEDPEDVTHVAGLEVAEDRWFPLASQAGAWVDAALACRGRGRLVVLDYAATTAEIATRPLEGWLRTFRGHDRGQAPWTFPGEQDITADVPHDQLPAGLTISRQDAWLRRWGIDDLVEEGREMWRAGAHLGNLDALRGRSRVREAEALLDPAGLGGFLVMEWDRPGDPPPAGADLS